MTRLSPVLERILAVTTLCLAFIFMASIFSPRDTRAHDDDAAPNRARDDSTDPHAGLRSLGELHGARYIVRIYAGPSEPLYSIYDRKGNEVAVLLRAAQVDVLFPELELSNMLAGKKGEYLMLAEPDEAR